MEFDVILTNPPFQDTLGRGKTPHKLWIDFTKSVFSRHLKPGGVLCQVSPSSFRSPSNDILTLMKSNQTRYINLDTGMHFEGVASTFSDYAIEKSPNAGRPTVVTGSGDTELVLLDESAFYLPNDFCAAALSIHKKVVFTSREKLPVKWDYVTCHNIRFRNSDTLVKERSETHCFPVFHTNRQVWWSSIRQPWADSLKVMWTRSGYTKPFFDAGEMGGTDMAYFVAVESVSDGEHLAHNLNLLLMRYIYATARWSGFGNEKVFAALPALPRDRMLTDDELFEMFELSDEEIGYVVDAVG